MKPNSNIEHPFDQFVNEQMQGAHILPPAECWQAIQDRMGDAIHPGPEKGNAPSLSQSPILKFTAAIFTTAAVASLIIYFVANSPSDSPAPLQTNQEIPKSPVPPSQTSNDLEVYNDKSTPINEEINASQTPPVTITEQKMSSRSSDEEAPISISEIPASASSETSLNDEEMSRATPQSNMSNIETIPTTEPLPKVESPEPVFLSDTFLCDKTFNNQIQYFNNPQISLVDALFMGQKYRIKELSSLELRADQKVRVRGIDTEGNRYIRSVSLNSQSLNMIPQNLSEGTLNLRLESANFCQDVYWYINNELKYTDVKDITYTRNMEFEHNQPLDVRVVCYNANGCPDSLILDAVPYLYDVRVPQIPSLFTPNSDGVNDLWSIKIQGEKRYHIKVYDMNNNLIFESKDKNKAWDGTDDKGKPLPSGWYVFNLEYAYPDETGVSRRNGMVQLKRD